jgi:hypothetical protein
LNIGITTDSVGTDSLATGPSPLGMAHPTAQEHDVGVVGAHRKFPASPRGQLRVARGIIGARYGVPQMPRPPKERFPCMGIATASRPLLF